MKILQLIQKPQLRGAEIFASQLSTRLVSMDHEVLMVCLTTGTATLPFSGTITYLNRPIARRLVDIAGWKQLSDLISQFQPDILQANAGDTLKFAVFSKLIFRWNTPIIFRNANKVSDFIDTKPKLYFNTFLARQVAHVISVSELCRLDFMKTYNIDQSKVTSVPIGIELKQENHPVPDDLKSFFEGGKILVHVASFVPEKNHAGLVRMVKLLVDRGIDIRLVMIGDGRLRKSIQQQVETLNLTQYIRLTGYRTDVLTIMSHAHAFVLPSLIEGLPGVILEAMYSRTAVVANDVGGISEVVKPGVTGWLVKAGEEEAFTHAIEEALHAPNGEAIKENAYTMVSHEFDNRMIAKRFMNVYERLINHN